LEGLLSKRIAAAVTVRITAIPLSVPSVGLAAKGREPPSKKPCPTHGHSSKRKGSERGKENGASNGKKCSTK
jgi:hypothetical protein